MRIQILDYPSTRFNRKQALYLSISVYTKSHSLSTIHLFDISSVIVIVQKHKTFPLLHRLSQEPNPISPTVQVVVRDIKLCQSAIDGHIGRH